MVFNTFYLTIMNLLFEVLNYELVLVNGNKLGLTKDY